MSFIADRENLAPLTSSIPTKSQLNKIKMIKVPPIVIAEQKSCKVSRELMQLSQIQIHQTHRLSDLSLKNWSSSGNFPNVKQKCVLHFQATRREGAEGRAPKHLSNSLHKGSQTKTNRVRF